jgi:hypothetical protein
MSGKASIPVLRSGNAAVDAFGEAVKQNLDTITGQQKNVARLSPLSDTATLAEAIARANELLERLQS